MVPWAEAMREGTAVSASRLASVGAEVFEVSTCVEGDWGFWGQEGRRNGEVGTHHEP